MSLAKVIQLSFYSTTSFDDAVKSGVAKASETAKGITGAWVNDMKVFVADGAVTEYRVNMKVGFVVG
jgi:flavin-binding protein dodecin